MEVLKDAFGRQFHYLRLSVTEVCNFRCTYCLPSGYRKPSGQPPPLSVGEIRNLTSAFTELGFWKVRLTGGEPTVRQDIVAIAEAVASTAGIRSVALSTNGYRLPKLARPLREAGVTALNVSVDSLDPERFAQITGHDRLADVLTGIDAAMAVGFDPIKINTVLMRGINEKDVTRFVEWARHTPLTVRFIELMRTGHNETLFARHHFSLQFIETFLLEQGWQPRPREAGAGPAREFEHPGYQGRIGLIAPYANNFCAGCNRLRVSSRGTLKLCLFGHGETSLRHLLQSASQRAELTAYVQTLIGAKKASHALHEGNYGDTWNLASIGG